MILRTVNRGTGRDPTTKRNTTSYVWPNIFYVEIYTVSYLVVTYTVSISAYKPLSLSIVTDRKLSITRHGLKWVPVGGRVSLSRILSHEQMKITTATGPIYFGSYIYER